MFSISSLILLSAASSHLFIYALAQTVVFPYNCASKTPICQTDCITAVNDICSGKVGALSEPQQTTVNGCTAKYTPHNNVADHRQPCLSNFRKILDVSNPSATACDGKTLPQVGGVLAFDATDRPVAGTWYAIFPASNNPNCVVNPSQVKALVPQQYSLNGRIYNPALCPNPAGPNALASSGSINTRSAVACGFGIAAAAICGSSCVFSVAATLFSFATAAPIAWASCLVCTAPATWGVIAGCYQKKRDLQLGRPAYSPRTAKPELCQGSSLNPSLTIIPNCVKDAFADTCAGLNTATA